MVLEDIFHKANKLKSDIEKLRPIKPEIEKRIMQKFRLDWNFHSNNIEGNSLTFGETKSFLLHGITAQGKPLKDHLDIKGHNEALLLLDDVLKERRPLTETFIRGLHEIILHEPYDVPAVTTDGNPTRKRIEIGRYKSTPNHVQTATGEIFYFATPEETPAKMRDLLNWYESTKDDASIHPLELSAKFHYTFIRIHPFDDGNGRMARILMNLILMSKGYPPVIIKTQDKTNYLRSLQQADGGDINIFISYIGEQLIHSLDLYLSGALGEDIEEMDDVDKEIALLKVKYNSDIKIYRSIETQVEVLNKSLDPLLEVIFQKVRHFDDMFAKQAQIIWYKHEGFHYGDRKYILQKVKDILSKDDKFEKIAIKLEWSHFEPTNNAKADISLYFEIGLSRNRYEIRCPSNSIPKIEISNPYHVSLSMDDCKHIASAMAKHLLSFVKKELGEN